MLRALLIAPPGAGKGTQGDRLAEIYGVRHIATGDLLRQHVERGTALGRTAQSYMDKGDLVADEIVFALVLEQIGGPEPASGFVLDGFPRTMVQARLAYEWGVANDRTLHAAVSLDVPTDQLLARTLARGEATGRTDDAIETIRERLRVYAATTEPLLELYRERDILIEVDGTGTVPEVTDRIRARLDRLQLD